MAVTNYFTMNGQFVGESTNGVRTDYHRDALGSVVATTDQSQNVTTTARYAAYGTPFATTGDYATLRFGWCGSLGYRKTQRSGSGLQQAEAHVRARHYSTSTARWTTADPIQGDSNAYRYRANSPAVLVDKTGELTVVTLPGGNWHAQCGGHPEIWWDFVLKHKAPCDGYFVQQVTVSCVYNDCKSCPSRNSQISDRYEYWEAWFVYAGHEMIPAREPPTFSKWTDRYYASAPTGTFGSYLQIGIVKFFCRTTTGNLPTGDWQINKTYGRPDVCPTSSFAQPTTGQEPDWFAKDTGLVAGPGARVGFTSWSCCGDSSDDVLTVVYPPLSRP